MLQKFGIWLSALFAFVAVHTFQDLLTLVNGAPFSPFGTISELTAALCFLLLLGGLLLACIVKARLNVLLKVLIRLVKARLKVILKILIRLLKARLKVPLQVLVMFVYGMGEERRRGRV